MSSFHGNFFSKNEAYAYEKGYRIDKDGNAYGLKHRILKPYIDKKIINFFVAVLIKKRYLSPIIVFKLIQNLVIKFMKKKFV